MKRLIFSALLFALVCAQAQVQTIRLDAKKNALLLTSNNAKMVGDLTPNKAYTVSVTTTNLTPPMQGAFFMVQDPSEVQCRYVPAGGSFQFVPISSPYQLAAFYVDWSSTLDNSGTVKVNITGPTTRTLTIDAKDNAILLDNVSTIVGQLDSTQDYVVSVRDSGMAGIAMRGAYFMYQEFGGAFQFKYIPPGQAFHFKPSSYLSYQLAPLYVDWSTTADNKGVTFVDIARLNPVLQTIRLDAKKNALLLTSNNAKIVGDLTPNQAYTVSVTATNVTAPMQGAFFMVQDSSEVQCRYVPSGGSFQFVPLNSPYQLAAFYVDWSSILDNSGTVTVNITGPTTRTLTIDARDNAILLDSVSTIVGQLDSTQDYVVSVRDSGMAGIAMRGAYFMYHEFGGAFQFKYIPPGQAFHFYPSSYLSSQLAPLYVDWSTTADNHGMTFIDIAKPISKIPAGVLESERTALTFLLEQNYPNPFNPSTTIRFSLLSRSYVVLTVFDALGRKVADLVNEEKGPGSNEVVFDGSKLSSGVYWYRLQAGGRVETKTLVLEK